MNMENKLISVIIPVYNSKEHLKECIESVVRQSYDKLEIIIVNDGSTDGSIEILHEICDSRIRVFTQDNKGVSAARNFGITESSGDYLCFVDSDDVLESDFISKLFHSLCISRCDVIYSGYKFLYPDGKTIAKQPRLGDGVYLVDQLLPIVIDDGTLSGILFGSVWAALYNAHTVKSNNLCFRESLRVNEDGIFNIEYLKLCDSVCITSEDGYLYRQREQKRKKELSFDSAELNAATKVLESLSSTIPNGIVQMVRRRLSVFFWVACRVGNAKNGCFCSVKMLRGFCGSLGFSKGDFDTLDFARMSKSKRLLLFLLKKRLYFMFVLVMRTAVPFAVRRIRH